MIWRRPSLINENFLLTILHENINNKTYILNKCQSITSPDYCNFVHKNGKNKGYICGTISKHKNGRCYTHSRNKKYRKTKMFFEFNIITVILFIKLYKKQKYISYKNYENIFLNANYLINIDIIIFQKETYNIIVNSLYINNEVYHELDFQKFKIVEKNKQIKISEINNSLNQYKKSKKKKKNKKNKKILKLIKNIKLDIILEKLEHTFDFFEGKDDKNDLYICLNILFKENKKLFIIFINIILSNVNLFFKDINMNIFMNIWRNITEHKQYERVLIYSDIKDEDIVGEVFSYVRNNYELIPESNQILWIRNNSIIPYYRKYNIKFDKNGIKIYYFKDITNNNPLPLHDLIILYY